MTLILSLVTPDFVCHVSDRQLTDLRTGNQLVSRASKTVIVPAAQFMVSYTGLAQITPTLSTDEWLMRTIWEARDSDDAFGSLADAASAAFAKIRLPARFKRHAFVISGWIGSGSYETDAALPPNFVANGYCTCVTNTLDLDARVELLDASDTFVHRTRPLFPHERFHIFAAGESLTRDESDDLDSNVAAALRSKGGRERAAAVAMLRTVEKVSARTPSVGGGAFICAIPRQFVAPAPAPPRSLSILGVQWGLPREDSPTFVHVPDAPTQTVESPAIIADPFAGRAELTIHSGSVPDLAGAGEMPEAGEMKMRLIALRSSDEISRIFDSPDDTTAATEE